MPVRSHIRYHRYRYHMLTGTIRYRYCKTQNLLVNVEKKATARHRPGPEWGTWGNPQELNWFLPLIKPLRRTRSLRDPAQTQVWSKQVWLDTTFISQGSQSWGKLAFKTWRVKTELIIITRVLDPHWFNADPHTDPDPVFFLIADPDPGSGSRIRIPDPDPGLMT